MVILQSLLLTGLILLGRRWIRQHAALCYGLAILLALLTVSLIWSGVTVALPAWMGFVLPILTQGALAGVLFMAVMFAAAVPDGSAFMRAVMPVRAELSIIASILTLGHNVAYGRHYFARLITGGALSPTVMAATICSLAMLAIMLPLFVTSFKSVRRKMQPRRWKRLQRWAYGFYFLMYVHVMLLNLHSAQLGNVAARINVVVYSAIFMSYGCLRIGKALRKRQYVRIAGRLPVCAAVMMLCVCCVVLGSNTSHALEDSGHYADGVYRGAGVGYNGRMTVSVTIENGDMTGIRVTGHVEDEPYMSDTLAGIIPAVLEKQSVEVDLVSGATSNAAGLLDAISSALASAKED